MVPARSPRHPERELLRAAPRVTVTCSAYTLARPSGGILTGSTGTPRVCDPRGRGGADRHSVSSCLLGAPRPVHGVLADNLPQRPSGPASRHTRRPVPPLWLAAPGDNRMETTLQGDRNQTHWPRGPRCLCPEHIRLHAL